MDEYYKEMERAANRAARSSNLFHTKKWGKKKAKEHVNGRIERGTKK